MQDVNNFLLEKADGSLSTSEKYGYVIAAYLRFLKELEVHYTEVDREVSKLYIRKLLLWSPSNSSVLSSKETQKSFSALKTIVYSLANFYDYLITANKTSINPFYVPSKGRKNNAEAFLNGIVSNRDSEKTILSRNLTYKETRHWLKWYTTAEIEMICSTFNRYRDKVIFLISIETGMRIGEILGLRLSSFDYNKQLLIIKDTENTENDTGAKTGGRIVPISPLLSSVILFYLESERIEVASHDESNEHYLFLTHQGPTKGKAMGTRNYLRILKSAGKRAGFEESEMRTHSGRSTTIQRLLELIDEGVPGVSIKFMEEVLGLQERSFKHYKKSLKARYKSKTKEVLDSRTPLQSLKSLQPQKQIEE
ncbi:tyrosine-type recombinase/integrase [Pontibacillus sp. HMF3514]|uniref:tyrosine-type recombinase/integrase n=1 Tax=Pontibacillus sp. HMF3514 TaxID=2692425 RepID=UPI00131F9271|nr:tyrosine-type recombinase/integrase [Pontibacillus sp. HMF3514]QHE52798.1 tyrosine-type recombinase/integrase [Pontibacillus sp. HMF3514]